MVECLRHTNGTTTLSGHPHPTDFAVFLRPKFNYGRDDRPKYNTFGEYASRLNAVVESRLPITTGKVLQLNVKEAFMAVQSNTQAAPVAFQISNAAIHQDAEGRYCLNDLYKASGSNPKNKPSEWLRNKQAIELITELNLMAGIPAINSKTKIGTYAAKELVYAYAMWISPKFHLQVIRAYDALYHGSVCYVPDDQGVSLYFPKLSRPEQQRRWLVTQARDEMVLMWSVPDDKELVSDLEMVKREANDDDLLALLVELVKPSVLADLLNLVGRRLAVQFEAKG
jgi:hypothetical protein